MLLVGSSWEIEMIQGFTGNVWLTDPMSKYLAKVTKPIKTLEQKRRALF